MSNQLNNLEVNGIDPTTDYFNNFFKPEFDVSGDVDTTIIGFFEKMTANKASAKALASSLIFTSLAQGLDPMEILHNFTKLPKGQIDAYMAMFLNLNRVGTSLIGISNQPSTSKYVARAILA